MRRRLVIGGCVAILAGGLWFSAGAQDSKKEDPGVVRARETVQMLDDVYKTAVVLVTDKYVNTPKDLPAGSAFKALFTAISKKGHHDVRLLDASGQPLEDSNVAKDTFEKDAVKQILAGKPFVEAVEARGTGRVYRAATAVPVVMEKCTMCHDNYKTVKKGQAIGALSYTLPIK